LWVNKASENSEVFLFWGMQNYRFTILFVFGVALLFLGCQTPLERSIIDWEQTHRSLTISSIDSISHAERFSAKDSLTIMIAQIDEFTQMKLLALTNQYLLAEKEFQKAKLEIDSITNPIMKKVFSRAVISLEQKAQLSKTILDVYTNHPEQTQLKRFFDTRDYYQSLGNQLLGYKFTVYFKGAEGDLPVKSYRKIYLISIDHSTILGELQ